MPEHLLVLGGGYIGLEFGQMFRRFGSRVTIVQRGPRLLAREDADVADAVADDPARGRHRGAARNRRASRVEPAAGGDPPDRARTGRRARR